MLIHVGHFRVLGPGWFCRSSWISERSKKRASWTCRQISKLYVFHAGCFHLLTIQGHEVAHLQSQLRYPVRYLALRSALMSCASDLEGFVLPKSSDPHQVLFSKQPNPVPFHFNQRLTSDIIFLRGNKIHPMPQKYIRCFDSKPYFFRKPRLRSFSLLSFCWRKFRLGCFGQISKLCRVPENDVAK